MIDFNKVKTVISHEYVSRVKTKGFIFGTLLGPLVMILVMCVPAVIMLLSMDSTHERIAILDLTKQYASGVVAEDKATFYESTSSTETLADSLRAEQLDGYVILDSNYIKNGVIVLCMKGSGGFALKDKITSVLGKIRQRELMHSYGVDAEAFNDINKDITVKQIKISMEKEEKNEVGNSDFQIDLAYIVGFAIYMMLILYGTMVMRGVIEEKTSRIVEVLAASIRPFDFMLGKVVGIGLVGITQMLVWVFGGGLILLVANPILKSFGIGGDAAMQEMGAMTAGGMPEGVTSGQIVPTVSISVLLAILFFFIIGYFIYATLYAAVASAVDREDDANNITTPIMMLIIIPFWLMSSVMADPNSVLATVTSLFPFFSPMLMLARIIITDGQIPAWQILLSIGLCLATFIGCLWVSARIYRVGILMYGKKPTFKMLWKWVRQSD